MPQGILFKPLKGTITMPIDQARYKTEPYVAILFGNSVKRISNAIDVRPRLPRGGCAGELTQSISRNSMTQQGSRAD